MLTSVLLKGQIRHEMIEETFGSGGGESNTHKKIIFFSNSTRFKPTVSWINMHVIIHFEGTKYYFSFIF